jgi:hypothetical protein
MDILRIQGAALYRAGRFQEAAQRLAEVLKEGKFEGTAFEHLFLALVHQRLARAEKGDPAEARKWLQRATAWLASAPQVKELPWHVQAQLALLRQEAESALNEKD